MPSFTRRTVKATLRPHLCTKSIRWADVQPGPHIVPGYFGPSGFTGILLYDQGAGFGGFYDSDGKGNLVALSQYSGWRTSWTHIVVGRFVASSPYSAVFFYSASENYGEIWATDGKGLAGSYKGLLSLAAPGSGFVEVPSIVGAGSSA